MFPRTSDYLIALFAVSAMFLALFAGTGPSQAATFSIIAQGHSMTLKGDIEIGDAARIDRAYRDACNKRGFCPERLFLDSNGGRALESFKIADFVVNYGLHTVVGKTALCYSACFNIFAAGVIRVVFPSSIIGVHSISVNGGESAETLEMTRQIAKIMRDDMHVPAPIITKFLTTPPSEIAILTWDDVQGWVQVLE
jgi:hypothetical protein